MNEQYQTIGQKIRSVIFGCLIVAVIISISLYAVQSIDFSRKVIDKQEELSVIFEDVKVAFNRDVTAWQKDKEKLETFQSLGTPAGDSLAVDVAKEMKNTYNQIVEAEKKMQALQIAYKILDDLK